MIRRSVICWSDYCLVIRTVRLYTIGNLIVPAVLAVLAFHLHHEHGEHPGHCGHHQLELQGPAHPLHAQLDTGCLHQGRTTFLIT
jgi:hypothetical protein